MLELEKEELEELEAIEENWRLEQERRQIELHTVYEKIPGYDFLAYCKMPLHFRARIREMRVGDMLVLGSIRSQYGEAYNDFEGVLEIYITKEKGQVYRAHSNFNLLSKPTRSHKFTEFTFKLEKGGFFAFTGNVETSKAQRKMFALTCRYFDRLDKHTSYDEWREKVPYRIPKNFHGLQVDKDRKMAPFLSRDENGELTRTTYQIAEELLPKTMIQCVTEYALTSGLINFDEQGD
ncbi:hypothetical protein VIBNIFTn2_1110041 [Vibrio nigripulchritudo FTn2]|uniref:hypothetical protein n=1 Tax=Vibrio nigripulchritudo TaxID=28173 RepID=UPI0003B1D4F8|nr:hypothetical protein [Vibrio nigripulchritudo]BCL74172.1 hypothetical protein VNTUMSATTG_61090 [Vibrio nigripulchritudo]CCN39743.1 hypothetical protein VIBNIFTn2_1110041 [Vibrio nigripulchritudo FTn2]